MRSGVIFRQVFDSITMIREELEYESSYLWCGKRWEGSEKGIGLTVFALYRHRN